MTMPLRPPGGGHVGLEVLADLDEGLLDSARASAVEAHLAGCGSCRADRAALHAVRAELAADDPGPMPASVVARLDAALNAETGRRPASARVAAAVPTPASLSAARERRAARRGFPARGLLGAAAALALFVGGGAIAVQGLGAGGGSASSSSAGGGPGAASNGDAAAGREPGGRADGPALGMSAKPGNGSSGAGALAHPRRVLHTGDSYSPATLAPLVHALVAAPGPGSPGAETPPPTPASPSPEALTSPTGSSTPPPVTPLPHPPALESRVPSAPVPAGLAGCLEQQQIAADTRPLAVDTGSWQDQPALVVVLPAEPTRLRVLVLAAGCSASESRLLYDTTLSR